MRKTVLNRYATTREGKLIIDVAASRVQDLYNDFDRNAPYVRRDLDQDLSDYLLDCGREIGRRPFMIRITLGQIPSEQVVVRVKQSIRNFFRYLGDVEKRKMRRSNITSLILLSIGLCIFAIAILMNRIIPGRPGFFPTLLTEGLTVAAWVSLWEALATFLIHWAPFRRTLRVFDNLANAPVVFGSQETAGSDDMAGADPSGASDSMEEL